MLVESLVFGGDESGLNAIWHSLDRQIHAAFAREFRHEATVRCMDARHHRRLVFCEHFVIGQFLCEASNIDSNSPGYQKRQNGSNPEEISDKPYHKSGILPSDHSQN